MKSEKVRMSYRETAKSAGACLAPDDGAHSAAMTIFFALMHAALFLCAYPPVNAWPLVFLAPAPLIWLAINARTTRRALIIVLIVQLLMWLWMSRWLIEVTVVGWPPQALCMSLYALAFVWVIRRLSRHRRLGRWPMALLAPVAWVGLECLRGELAFDGYPWFLLGHPLIEWPVLAQSADLLGTYFISFLAGAVAGAIIDLLRAWARQTPTRRAIIAAVVVMAVQALNIGYGVWRMRAEEPGRDELRILAIQTNLPQSNKVAWGLEDQRRDVASFIELTRRAFEAAAERPDLIVWPETMLPVRGLELETLQTLDDWRQEDEVGFAIDVFRLSDDLRTPMLVGSPCYLGLDVSEEGLWIWQRNYNSAYLVDGLPPYQRYDKYFLTPFGEVMPYISAWPWLEEKLLAVGAEGMTFNLDSNPEIERLLLTPRRGGRRAFRLATPICFEDTVGRVCRRMVYDRGAKRADVLVNLSNDGWFGEYDAGRAQHAQIARFRCIENRVPMVRCANTGLSVAFDAQGRVLGRIGQGRYGEARRAGWLSATVSVEDETATLYGRTGDAWAWACLLSAAALTVGTFVARRKG